MHAYDPANPCARFELFTKRIKPTVLCYDSYDPCHLFAHGFCFENGHTNQLRLATCPSFIRVDMSPEFALGRGHMAPPCAQHLRSRGP
jgi:hypothetical protein